MENLNDGVDDSNQTDAQAANVPAVTIYNYHPITGEYIGLGIADDNPLEKDVPIVPGYATTVEPPTAGERRVALYLGSNGHPPQNWADGSWTVKPDYRDETLYRTVDGSTFTIGDEYSGIGDLPPFLTDEPRPSRAHVWQDDEWVLDEVLEISQLTAAAASKRDGLLADADREMQPLFDSFFLGESTPEEDAKRVALSQYRKALRAVTAQAGFPRTINWPVKPA